MFGFLAVSVFARIAAVRERGLGVITVLVFGTQVGLHLLFAAAESADAPAPAPVPAPAPAPDVMSAMSAMPDMVAGHGSGQPMGHLSAGMLCGHVLAALAAAWWLRRGEDAVHRCAHRAAARIGAPMDVLYRLLVGSRVGFAASPAPAAGPRTRPQATGGRLIRFVVIRRGPPALTLR